MHKKLDIETVARDVVTFPALADRLNTIEKEDENKHRKNQQWKNVENEF